VLWSLSVLLFFTLLSCFLPSLFFLAIDVDPCFFCSLFSSSYISGKKNSFRSSLDIYVVCTSCYSKWLICSISLILVLLIAVLLHTPVLYSRGWAALDAALLNDKVSETGYKPFHACSTFSGVGWSVRLVLGRCVKCCRLTWECVYCSFVRSVVSLCICSAQRFLLIVCGSYLVNLFNYYMCVLQMTWKMSSALYHFFFRSVVFSPFPTPL